MPGERGLSTNEEKNQMELLGMNTIITKIENSADGLMRRKDMTEGSVKLENAQQK